MRVNSSLHMSSTQIRDKPIHHEHAKRARAPGSIIADAHAAVAAFLALLWPRLKAADGRFTAAVAAMIALVAVPFVPAGVPVLIAAVAAVAIGLRSGRTGATAPPPDPTTDGDVIP